MPISRRGIRLAHRLAPTFP